MTIIKLEKKRFVHLTGYIVLHILNYSTLIYIIMKSNPLFFYQFLINDDGRYFFSVYWYHQKSRNRKILVLCDDSLFLLARFSLMRNIKVELYFVYQHSSPFRISFLAESSKPYSIKWPTYTHAYLDIRDYMCSVWRRFATRFFCDTQGVIRCSTFLRFHASGLLV